MIHKVSGNTAVICFSPNDGGMEHDATFMAQSIAEHLANCLLVVREGTWLQRYAKQHDIPCVAIAFRGSFSLKAILAMRRLWVQHDISNVIFLGASEIRSIHFSIVPPIKTFIVRHGTTKSSSKKDLVHRLTWSRVKAHWCISEHLKRNVMDLFPICKARVFVNYPGLGVKLDYLPEARPLTNDDTTLRLAHVGRLVAGKGQRDALEVVKQARDRGVPATLTCFGGGNDQNELEARIARLGLEGVVFLAGYVPHPYRHFGDYHGFLFPSRGEGFGNVFAEALATGMHCFSYDNTVFPEFRQLGLYFHMVDDRNIEALSDAVVSVWEKREPLPMNNIALCNKLFSSATEMSILAEHLV